MPIIKFSVDQDHYNELCRIAQSKGISVQDVVREKVFNKPSSIFVPSEAVRRALSMFADGTPFTLPQLYGDEWAVMKRGVAGIFGRQFFDYITENCPNKIMFVGMTPNGRLAQYKVLSVK